MIKDNNYFAVDWMQYFGAEPPEKENSWCPLTFTIAGDYN